MVKCKWCGEEVSKENAYVIKKETSQLLKSGKPKILRTYFHQDDKDCIDKYLADQEKKAIEQEQLNSLIKKVLNIHGFRPEDIPRRYYTDIQDMRNGYRHGSRKDVKSKGGTPYYVIEATYDDVRWNIEYAKLQKDFKDAYGELAYGLSIVRNRLPIIRQQELDKIRAKKAAKKQLKKKEFIETESNYKNKKYENDISDFLD